MTSGLTFLTVIALFAFGGPVLRGFSFALVCGIIVGTYSSVFVASPIVLFWHNYMDKPKRFPGAGGAAAARKDVPRTGGAKPVKGEGSKVVK
jgi:preprotein translocase subunit SecF